MKQQSIKSLKEQVKNVKIENFVIANFQRGDFGYNCIKGVLDNKI